VASTNEVASTCMIEDRACRNALWELEKYEYVEYHPNDPYIDWHLSSAQQKASSGEKKDENIWLYWRIRRPGVSAALRAWGVSAGAEFRHHSERNRLLDSVHRRRSRQSPLCMCLKHVRSSLLIRVGGILVSFRFRNRERW
jgi:hypothetical protein